MAEESYYSSDNKRKYDDSDTPPSRRATGFSAPIHSQTPTGGSSGGQQPASYNNTPPPLDDIELAKQKAQEIAARIFSDAEAAAKKPRVENGGGGGFDSSEGYYQKTFTPSVPSATSSYGYPGSGTTKKIEVPNGKVGVIIGKGGETIKYLQMQSGAKIQITRDMDADPYSATRSVDLMGTPEQISKAEELIQDVLAEANTGGSGLVSRGVTGEQTGSDHFVMKVANNKVGLVIGKGGETIKNMQGRTGARIQVIPLHLPPGDTSTERTVQIHGTSEQIEAAKQLINEVTAENRPRNQSMSGGYSQQGYQARPQTNWAPPGAPLQQPGYGYLQPGAYPPPQYNMNQSPYPGYPPQPTSGGYATGWDQTSAPSNQQQPVQGGGYDYYGQQQQPPPAGGPTDNSSYAYNQQPASGYNQGQGYDGYGGYNAPAPQPGYGQPQPNPASGYDQQQSYNSTPGYDSASNPPPDGHTSQQPSPKPSYPSQPGYGAPPPPQAGGYGTQPAGGYNQGYAQKSPTSQSAYGQPQQSPSAQGGYNQPSQLLPGYAPLQSGYAPPSESAPGAAQRPPPPSAGYGPPSAQPGYGGPYGAPPPAQPNYGQAQAPPYGYSYTTGGGYSQPQAYSGDGSGTNDSTPSQGAVQPSDATKPPPQS